MITRALLLLCWTFAAVAAEPSLSDFLKAQIQPQFPARIETLQCDPGSAPVFQCRGRLIDGRLVQVEAKRAKNGAITITDLVHHIPAAESMRHFLQPVLQPPLATIDCPPEQPTLGAIECGGTLTDGSRFTVAGNRRRDFALEVGPVTYDANAPAPLVQAARKYVESFAPPVKSLICPAEPLTSAILCTAVTTNDATATVRVIRKPDGTLEGVSEFDDSPLLRHAQQAARIAVIIGPLLAIAGTIMLVRLQKRSFIARVPLTPDQQLVFEEPGGHVMMAEGPRFTFAWRGLQFSLRHAASGTEVPLYVDIMNVRVSGWSRVRRSFRRFTIIVPGTYVLHLTTDPAGRDLSKLSAYFGRSFLVPGLLAVILIAGGSVLFLAGLLLSIG